MNSVHGAMLMETNLRMVIRIVGIQEAKMGGFGDFKVYKGPQLKEPFLLLLLRKGQKDGNGMGAPVDFLMILLRRIQPMVMFRLVSLTPPLSYSFVKMSVSFFCFGWIGSGN